MKQVSDRGSNKQKVDKDIKLLLVNPNDPTRYVNRPDQSMYPYSLLFLLSYLYKNNFKDGRILDLTVAKHAEIEFEKYLKESQEIKFRGF